MYQSPILPFECPLIFLAPSGMSERLQNPPPCGLSHFLFKLYFLHFPHFGLKTHCFSSSNVISSSAKSRNALSWSQLLNSAKCHCQPSWIIRGLLWRSGSTLSIVVIYISDIVFTFRPVILGLPFFFWLVPLVQFLRPSSGFFLLLCSAFIQACNWLRLHYSAGIIPAVQISSCNRLTLFRTQSF